MTIQDRRHRLNKRLAAYSAMACAATASGIGSGTAYAEVRVTDIPDFTVNAGALRFNMVSGAISYGTHYIGSFPHPDEGDFVLVGGAVGPWITPVIYGKQTFAPATTAFVTSGSYSFTPDAQPLAASDTVSPADKFSYIYQTTAGYGNFAVLIENWSDNQRGFIGIRFELDGATHFGFAEITRGERNLGSAPVTLHAFGYETDPNTPIHLAVPEPGTLTVLALGATGVAAFKRRRRRIDR